MRLKSVTVIRKIGGTTMLSTNEIRSHIVDYIKNENSLEVFEDWFASASWNVHQFGSKDLQALVFDVENRLAEHSGNYVDEKALRHSLLPLVSTYSVDVFESGSTTIKTAGSMTVHGEDQSWSADKRPSLVCA